jgi:hypothetical protein
MFLGLTVEFVNKKRTGKKNTKELYIKLYIKIVVVFTQNSFGVKIKDQYQSQIMRLTTDEYTTAEDEAERLSISEDIGHLVREYISIRYHLKSREGIAYNMCELCTAVAETSKSFQNQEGMFKEMSVKELLIMLHAINIILNRQKITRWLCPDCHNHSGARKHCDICRHPSCRSCHKKLWSSPTICDLCSKKCKGCWKSYDKILLKCPYCQFSSSLKKSKHHHDSSHSRAEKPQPYRPNNNGNLSEPSSLPSSVISSLQCPLQCPSQCPSTTEIPQQRHQKEKTKKKNRKHEKTIVFSSK